MEAVGGSDWWSLLARKVVDLKCTEYTGAKRNTIGIRGTTPTRPSGRGLIYKEVP